MSKIEKIGRIIKKSSNKTALVQVDRFVSHPVYKKRYRITKKYLAHDEKGDFQIEDKVKIVESKPISKNKRFIIVEKVK